MGFWFPRRRNERLQQQFLAELKRMQGESRKRQSHYEFAHRALRRMARAQPLKVFALLLSDQGCDFLSHLYNEIKAQARDEVDIAVGPRDFAVTPVRICDQPGCVVTLPKPIRQAEAFLVAVVLCMKIGNLADAIVQAATGGPEPELRYFTLELGHGGRTVLCEWEEPDQHCNYGDGGPAEVAAFTALVVGQCQANPARREPVASANLRGPQGPVVRSGRPRPG
jgi:hypothetical protein